MTAPLLIVRRKPHVVPGHPYVVIDLRPWSRIAVAACTTWREAQDLADHLARRPKPGGRP